MRANQRMGSVCVAIEIRFIKWNLKYNWMFCFFFYFAKTTHALLLLGAFVASSHTTGRSEASIWGLLPSAVREPGRVGDDNDVSLAKRGMYIFVYATTENELWHFIHQPPTNTRKSDCTPFNHKTFKISSFIFYNYYLWNEWRVFGVSFMMVEK